MYGEYVFTCVYLYITFVNYHKHIPTMETLSKPVYLKNSEIQKNRSNRISDFELMEIVIRSVGDTVRCIQLDRDLWRIYLTKDDSKQKLIEQGVDIEDQNFNVYDQNPYTTGSKSPADRALKVTVSGVPLSVDDHEILVMLKKLGANPKSDLQYEKIRNPVTKKMTGVLNGNRYIYIEPLPVDKFLPRSSFCAGIQCRIYHFGQPKPPKRKCLTCWSSDHPTSKCTEEAKCKVCLQSGHAPGDEQCTSYAKKSPNSYTLFHGDENILSNFYPCEISVFGENYNSAEQAFQCVKAVRSGDLLAADKIRAAKSALEAKKIGNLVTPSESWISSQVKVMSEIISEKAEQVETFRETLENSTKNVVFAETTYDDYWATGLNFDQSVHTKPSAWPGKNVLGQILGRVATEVKKKQKTKSKSGQLDTQ